MLSERDNSQQNSIDSSWRFSQFDHPERYTQWTHQALQALDMTRVQKVAIFNCSDGPSALGFVKCIVEKNSSASTLLTDIQQGVPEACTDFIQKHFSHGIDLAVHCVATEYLHTIPMAKEADLFLSFEPIGDLQYAFTRLHEVLSPGSRIVVVERGVLSHGIQALRKVAKALDIKDYFSVIPTGMLTPQGEIVVGALQRQNQPF